METNGRKCSVKIDGNNDLMKIGTHTQKKRLWKFLLLRERKENREEIEKSAVIPY